MNKMLRYPLWGGRGQQVDPVRQIFDRLFDGNLFQDGGDESSVVTSQWSPLVDIKEEADRFVVYADIPGVDPQDIEVQMDQGLLTVKGERSAEEIRDTERYSRTDTSVTGQVLKLVSAKPDAILIAASGTPAVLPQRTLKERGYAGQYYQTHGVANNDFLRVGGKDIEGTYLPAGPVLVAAQLPANNPVKASALDYIAKYEAANGKGSVSTFGAHAWDAGRLMSAAAAVALKTAQPGTPAFRAALRDALEKINELHGAHGVFNMSPTDHLGLDQRARIMVKIENGTWKYQP